MSVRKAMQGVIYLVLEMDSYHALEMILYIMGSVLGAFLIGLSISAYRKSGLHKLKYAIVAFSLFSVFLIYEYVEHLLFLESPIADIMIHVTGLSILAFFFMAIIKKS
jgi:hypothetical protein